MYLLLRAWDAGPFDPADPVLEARRRTPRSTHHGGKLRAELVVQLLEAELAFLRYMAATPEERVRAQVDTEKYPALNGEFRNAVQRLEGQMRLTVKADALAERVSLADDDLKEIAWHRLYSTAWRIRPGNPQLPPIRVSDRQAWQDKADQLAKELDDGGHRKWDDLTEDEKAAKVRNWRHRAQHWKPDGSGINWREREQKIIKAQRAS